MHLKDETLQFLRNPDRPDFMAYQASLLVLLSLYLLGPRRGLLFMLDTKVTFFFLLLVSTSPYLFWFVVFTIYCHSTFALPRKMLA